MKKLRQLSGILALAGLLYVQPGCCTLEHLMDPEQKLSMYGGTIDCVRDMEDPRATFGEVFFRLFDIWPTIAVDTVMLPVTAPWQLTH